MAINWVDPDEFDLVVVGSGLPEVLIASSAAKAGKSVLIIDAVDTYGTDYSSFTLSTLQQCAVKSGSCHSTAESQKDASDFERAQAPRESPRHPLPEGWFSHSVPEQGLPVHNVLMFKQTPGSDGASSSDSSRCISDDEARRYILDLAPKMLYQAEALVDLMVRSRAQHYVEFKLIEASYILHRGVLAPVPASKSDIFKDKRLSLGEKRLLMKFINSMLGSDTTTPGASSQVSTATDVNRSFLATLQAAGLSQDLQHIVLHAIALADHDQTSVKGPAAQSVQTQAPAAAAAAALPAAAPAAPEAAECASDDAVRGWLPHALVSEQQGRNSLQLFMESMSRFSPGSAFMVPSYGCGSLPEAFVRQAAVFGAVTVLRQPVQALVTSPSAGGACCGIVTNSGQLIKCKALVAAASVAQVLLPASSPHPPVAVTHRALVIMDSSLAVTLSNLTLVIPPNSPGLGNPHAIRGLQLGPNTSAAPAGRFLLYLSTPAHSTDGEQGSPYFALWRAAALLTQTDGLAGGAEGVSFGLESNAAQQVDNNASTTKNDNGRAVQDIQEAAPGGLIPDNNTSNSSGLCGHVTEDTHTTVGVCARPVALHAYFYDQHSYEDPLCRPPQHHMHLVLPTCAGNSSSSQPAHGSGDGGVMREVGTASNSDCTSNLLPSHVAGCHANPDGASYGLPSNVGCCYGPDLGLAGYRLAVEQAERMCARLLPDVPWLPVHSAKRVGGGSDGGGSCDEQHDSGDADEDGDDAIRALQDAMLSLAQQPAEVSQDAVVDGVLGA